VPEELVSVVLVLAERQLVELVLAELESAEAVVLL
jgi:hypothetical protein